MKKVGSDTWIQLLGMLSVLAGPVFVGLEMRQSQRIALAAQQQARAALNVGHLNSFTESGCEALIAPETLWDYMRILMVGITSCSGC